MPVRIVVGISILTALFLALSGCVATRTPPSSSTALKPTPLPEDAGIPVKQWYMKTADEVVHYRAAFPEAVELAIRGHHFRRVAAEP